MSVKKNTGPQATIFRKIYFSLSCIVVSQKAESYDENQALSALEGMIGRRR